MAVSDLLLRVCLPPGILATELEYCESLSRPMRCSLGQYASQQRVESTISRDELSAATGFLEQPAEACCGSAPAAKPVASSPEVCSSGTPAARFGRGGMILTAVVWRVLKQSLAQ